jgi:hypothetical protein
MKTKVFLILLILPLFSSKCKKEGDDCHYTITIKNEGIIKVIYSTVLYYEDRTKCLLTRNSELNPTESYEEHLRMCWENELKYRNFEFYIVDPSNFNEGGFYDCDSIEHKNSILRHYIITESDLANLKANNFTITYP